jgi:hypothetical protein
MLRTNYQSIVNTPLYFSSLFSGNNKGQRAEWAGNVSFKNNVANVLKITEKINHGERGDMFLDFGEFSTMDERKILRIRRGNTKSGQVELRKPGRQGLHPLKVRVITVLLRADYSLVYPSEPTDIIGIFLLPVITESGNIAMRPDDPSSLMLCISCDVINQSEHIEIVYGKIADDTFPEHMCEIVGTGKDKKIRIKAIFYYDQLKNNPEKQNELRELYKSFAKRQVSENAIISYETAITDELIENEKSEKK